jgi:O-antigen/teichoic acid export membrane protein
VVGAVLGPLAVVTFSTLRTLTRLAMQIVAVLALAVEPELAAAHGAGDAPLMRRLFLQALGGGLWLALGAAALLALAGGPILDLWTHGRVAMQADLFGWLLASAVAFVLWSSSLIALKAANRHLHIAYVYALASASVVAVAALLLHWTRDLATAGLALLLMDGAMTLYALAAAGALLGLRPLASLVHAANPAALLRDLRGHTLAR